VRINMDKKKGKISTGGEEHEELSGEELTWLMALREFKLSPGPGGPEELNKFLKTFNKGRKKKC
jgi:hypothetical protein